jgi:H2-forming N5,N10-methylenetetrahydromethanopterin dehydrogenase-like enzyme
MCSPSCQSEFQRGFLFLVGTGQIDYIDIEIMHEFVVCDVCYDLSHMCLYNSLWKQLKKSRELISVPKMPNNMTFGKDKHRIMALSVHIQHYQHAPDSVAQLA